MTEKTYTQKEVDEIVNKTRIEERYLANKLMGDLGIPAANRKYPNEKISIYTEAADIVTSVLLAPRKEEQPEPPET